MPANPGTDSPSIPRLEPSWAFAACWVLVAVGLYLVGTPPSGPAVFPDEVCRLGWARLLSGTGPHFDMSPAAYCQPYYPLLLAPFYWLTHDPAEIQHGVFALNSAIAAACLPLAVRLGIRHFGMNTGTAWVAGIAFLAFPALTLYTRHAMPETALFAGVLLAFGLWCAWVDRPEWRRFAALMAMSVVLYALHRKMLVVPACLMIGAIAGYWFHRTPQYRYRTLLTALALTAVFLLDEFVKNTAMSGGLEAGDAGAVDLLTRLSSLRYIQHAVEKGTGVLVYATLVTGGCIWLVLGGGLDSVRRCIQEAPGSLQGFDRKSAFASGMAILLGGVTAMYFAEGTRFDFWFYGRHVNPALAVSLLPAIAIIARSRVDRTVLLWATALPVTAFLILAFAIPGPPWVDFSPVHVIGAGSIIEWMHEADSRWTLLAYCASIFAGAGTMWLTRLPGRVRFAALAPFFLVTTFTHLTTRPFQGVPIRTAIPEPAAEALRKAQPCHVFWDARNGGRLRMHQYFRLQYHFPNCSTELIPSGQTIPPNSLIVLKRVYAECGPASECHDLHPDLVLRRTAQTPIRHPSE